MIQVRKYKGGFWKRKVGIKGRKCGTKQGLGKEIEECRKQPNEKKSFCLVDEDVPEGDHSLEWKRMKVGMEKMDICQQMVEVASHNWPQLDQ